MWVRILKFRRVGFQEIPRKLLPCEIDTNPVLDWRYAVDTVVVGCIALYLTQWFTHNAGAFTHHGWRNIFHIREPVYRELCLEFFSTYSSDYSEIVGGYVFRSRAIFALLNTACFAGSLLHPRSLIMGPRRYPIKTCTHCDAISLQDNFVETVRLMMARYKPKVLGDWYLKRIQVMQRANHKGYVLLLEPADDVLAEIEEQEEGIQPQTQQHHRVRQQP
ncbi:hypothetical protein L1887_33236 [Cichorium endivia]|nr:hypothetical protein L1887_33236 [Cichorium endivia]